MLSRVMKCLGWRSLVIPLLVVGGVAIAWAQNTFPTVGNVGIGSMSPVRSLTIYAQPNDAFPLRLERGSVGAFDFSITPLSSNSSGDLVISGTAASQGFAVRTRDGSNNQVNALVVDRSGNVGVGTVGPAEKIDVVGSIQVQGSGGGGARLIIRDTSVNPRSWEWYPGVAGPNSLSLYERVGGRTILTLKSDGKLGVGTLNPSSQLHVSGDVRVDGNIAAKYQDIAEWVRGSGPLSPGTVVVIDKQERDGLVPSDQAYDTSVAGVVSPMPGLVLGQPGEGKVKVAHVGRVKVKVDATYGSIATGDLLVTSPTRGFAMRSEPVSLGGLSVHRPGTIIGKALEPFQDGQGEILVLLTLQ